MRLRGSRCLALVVGLCALGATLPAVAAQSQTRAIARRLTDEKAFDTFMIARQAHVQKSVHLWDALARRLMPTSHTALKATATPAEAAQLFTAFRDADIGTRVPIDGCAPRADVAAVAAMRAGFAVQKANYFSVGGPLKVKAGGKKMSWSFHVAPLIEVVGPRGKRTSMVLDPALFDRPVTLATWKRRMSANHGVTVVTGPDQLSYQDAPQSGEARVHQLAINLASVSGLRQFERSASATTPVATPAP